MKCWFFSDESYVAAKKFVLSGTMFCFRREIWWENFYSEKTTESFWDTFFRDCRQVACSIGRDVGQELGFASPSCSDRLSSWCISISAISRKQRTLFCTCSWLGTSPAKCSRSCGQQILWGNGLARFFILSLNPGQEICKARHTHASLISMGNTLAFCPVLGMLSWGWYFKALSCLLNQLLKKSGW